MTGDAPELSTEAKLLLARSGVWLADAMDAWSDGETEKVAVLAPLAVELSAKAVLWEANPALLAPLDRQHEASLIQLATRPSLSGAELRTIGLSEALNRAMTVIASDPFVSARRRKRISDCRNGSIHVGATDSSLSRHVLSDCVALLFWCLDHLAVPHEDLFASHLGDCRALLDQSQSELQQAVRARLAKHRKQYVQLQSSLSPEVAATAFEALEHASMSELMRPEQQGPELIPAQHGCPACERKGAIYGVLSVDADGESEYDPDGPTYHAWWVVTLDPQAFICKVCGLRLWGTQELSAAQLPFESYEPVQEDLGDFDVEEFMAGVNWDGDYG